MEKGSIRCLPSLLDPPLAAASPPHPVLPLVPAPAAATGASNRWGVNRVLHALLAAISRQQKCLLLLQSTLQ